MSDYEKLRKNKTSEIHIISKQSLQQKKINRILGNEKIKHTEIYYLKRFKNQPKFILINKHPNKKISILKKN